MQNEILSEYQGWWRIIETSQWVNDDLDILGTALISLTGCADQLRMFTLLACVNCKQDWNHHGTSCHRGKSRHGATCHGDCKLPKDGRPGK